jgi:hypothetical protein
MSFSLRWAPRPAAGSRGCVLRDSEVKVQRLCISWCTWLVSRLQQSALTGLWERRFWSPPYHMLCREH